MDFTKADNVSNLYNLESAPFNDADDVDVDDVSEFGSFSSFSSFLRRNDNGGRHQHHQKNEEDIIARREQTVSFCCRIIMFFTLFIAIILGCFLSYSYEAKMTNDDIQFRNEQYLSHMHALGINIKQTLKTKLVALESLSISFSSYASYKQHRQQELRTTNETGSTSIWPFVTIPDFCILAGTIPNLVEEDATTINNATTNSAVIGSVSIGFSPLVSVDQKMDWEEYSKNNRQWIKQAKVTCNHKRNRYLQQEQEQEQNTLPSNARTKRRDLQFREESEQHNTNLINNEIFGYDDDDNRDDKVTESNDIYFPLWQMYPLSENLINFDISGSGSSSPSSTTTTTKQKLQTEINKMLQTQNAILGNILLFDEVNTMSLNSTSSSSSSSSIVSSPRTTMFYPIFDKLNNNEEEDTNIVGMLSTTISWEKYLDGILPFDHHYCDVESLAANYRHFDPDVIAVLRNDCTNIDYSYKIGGGINSNTVSYLGQGDYHHSEFDDVMESISIVQQDEQLSTTTTERKHTTTTLIDLCNYTIDIYPNEYGYEVLHNRKNNIHHVLVIILALVGVCVTFVVIMYERLSTRRIDELVHVEHIYTEVVKDAFPAPIIQRLFDNENNINNNDKDQDDYDSNSMKDISELGGSTDNLSSSLFDENASNNRQPLRKSIIRNSLMRLSATSITGLSAKLFENDDSLPFGTLFENDYDDDTNNDGEDNEEEMKTAETSIRTSTTNVIRSSTTTAARTSTTITAISQQDLLENNTKRDTNTNDTTTPLPSAIDKPVSSSLAKPISDSFPNTTILFADVVGFTAWSSQREPAEVFLLLQTLYHAFDTVANQLNVFKVETVGDCYVAATGIPYPQDDHAVRCTRFAREIMLRTSNVTKELEMFLGPDTGDLKLKIGLHSGPITAGVLRGEKARFQLFGDTMNMTARMESTGRRNRIQCSTTTAQLLIEDNKGHWITKRNDLVQAKGKGEVQTYWVLPRTTTAVTTANTGSTYYEVSDHNASDFSDQESAYFDESVFDIALNFDSGSRVDPKFERQNSWLNTKLIFEIPGKNERLQRLIDWNVELMCQMLRQIQVYRQRPVDDSMATVTNTTKNNVKQRKSLKQNALQDQNNGSTTTTTASDDSLQWSKPGSSALDEIAELINLPKFDKAKANKKTRLSAADVELNPDVVSQLRDYVTTIASIYRNNAFHSFEHASHVTMSTNKLLKRIVHPDLYSLSSGTRAHNKRIAKNMTAYDLHKYTYGITSDPLTQFALIFCALIHDVDHAGVSNFQLVAEQTTTARLYKNKSVAEQNSVDLAWDLLMDPNYTALQRAIYTNGTEMKRFRQLVVNIVLATDIFDADMKNIRQRRWEKAFPDEKESNAEAKTAEERKTGEEEEVPSSVPTSCQDHCLSQSVTEKKQNNDAEKEDDDATTNLKATIVLEHLIQASDVAHTMQHWDIYLKWNERLFREMYIAYEAGRSSKNPKDGWYEGEIRFFDKYVIPLAKKLDDCGVFGVSSDEYLNYARLNRRQWAVQGDKIVADFERNYRETRASRIYHRTSSIQTKK